MKNKHFETNGAMRWHSISYRYIFIR